MRNLGSVERISYGARISENFVSIIVVISIQVTSVSLGGPEGIVLLVQKQLDFAVGPSWWKL